jgi:hypothetical protein
LQVGNFFEVLCPGLPGGYLFNINTKSLSEEKEVQMI